MINRQLQVKLCDLGISKFKLVANSLRTAIGYLKGTPYMAPEILLHGEESSKASDVWSLACTIVELFSEDYVWPLDKEVEEDPLETIKTYMRSHVTPNTNNIVAEFRKAVDQCFLFSPNERPSVTEILDALACLPLI